MEPCSKEKELQEVHEELFGNGKKGLHDSVLHINEKLDGMLKRQENNRIWVRGGVFAFGGLFCLAIFAGLKDHLKIEEFPKSYVNHEYMIQVLEAQNRTNTALEKNDLTNKAEVEKLQKEIENTNKMFEYMRVTRNAKLTDKK